MTDDDKAYSPVEVITPTAKTRTHWLRRLVLLNTILLGVPVLLIATASIAARLDLMVLVTCLLAAYAPPKRFRCLTAPARVVPALPGLVTRPAVLVSFDLKFIRRSLLRQTIWLPMQEQIH